MNKLVLCLLGLVVCQAVYTVRAEDESWESEEGSLESSEEDAARSFWSSLIGKSVDLLKKSVKIDGLSCNGASCRTCIHANIPKVINKEGCFVITYNRQTGANARIDLQVSAGNRNVWTGSLNAGKNIPSCGKLPAPISEICLQDVTVTVGHGGRPDGDVCLTINFKNFGVGTRICSAFRNGSLVPSVHPQIVKT